MIDTHVHLNMTPLCESADSLLNEALSIGITNFVVPGVNIPTSAKAIELASTHTSIRAAVGIHPEETGDIAELEKLAANPLVAAIGECGIDYTKAQDINVQKSLFGAHILIAKKLQKPLIIHCRHGFGDSAQYPFGQANAYTDTVDTLKHYCTSDGLVPRFVLHCVSGDQNYVQTCLDMGAYVSFAGNVTYPNAQSIQSLLNIIPLNRLLIETDAPFLSPQSKRGASNTPTNLKETLVFIAEFLGQTPEEMDRMTTENAKRFFEF